MRAKSRTDPQYAFFEIGFFVTVTFTTGERNTDEGVNKEKINKICLKMGCFSGAAKMF